MLSGVIGGHVGAHQRSGVAGDIQTGLEAVLQAHARHGLGGDAVPGVLGLEQRFGRLKLALIRSRSLDGPIADPARLEVHVRDPFGDEITAPFVTRGVIGS
ncbi:hypothetical protein ACVWY2_004193 [Bradyrhizobium sp. JR6.1]